MSSLIINRGLFAAAFAGCIARQLFGAHLHRWLPLLLLPLLPKLASYSQMRPKEQ